MKRLKLRAIFCDPARMLSRPVGIIVDPGPVLATLHEYLTCECIDGAKLFTSDLRRSPDFNVATSRPVERGTQIQVDAEEHANSAA
jgi:hypothetical protein